MNIQTIFTDNMQITKVVIHSDGIKTAEYGTFTNKYRIVFSSYQSKIINDTNSKFST